MAETVSVKDQAPEVINHIEQEIKNITPDKIGISIGPLDAEANRDLSITDVQFSTDGIVTLTGTFGYKTGQDALIHASITFDLNVKYNLGTQEIENAKLHKKDGPLEYTVDLEVLEEVMEGDFSRVLELIPNGGLVKRETKSEYDARKTFYQEKYGKDNIYFASSEFVRWASPETAGKFIIALIASGGSAAPAIIAEVRSQITKELVNIIAWMKTIFAGAAEHIAQDFVDGKPIAQPELKLIWQKVVYQSKVQVAGRSLVETPPVTHAAFVLVYETAGKPPADFDSVPDRTQADDSKLRPRWNTGARYSLGATGCTITFVKPGKAAANAGLAVGETILKADQKPLGVTDNSTDLLEQALKASPDQDMDLDVRSLVGDDRSVTIKLDPVF